MPDFIGFSLTELADLLQCELVGQSQDRILGVASLEKAEKTDASFLANPRYREAMLLSRAGVICIDHRSLVSEGKNFFISSDPSGIFQKIAELLDRHRGESAFTGIHSTAVIDRSAQIGQDVTIGPYAVVDANAQIGDKSTIEAHCFIGHHVQIGTDCHIHPLCVVREYCCLGNRVILQSGAVIGSCGFGYTTDAHGCHQKLKQIGIVVIEDDVEIGANATIDRSRFDATRIRRGTKIDNLVQIAHNVEVGEHNLIAAQTGIAGSAKTSHHVMMGGQVGVLGHIEISSGALIAARSGISKSIPCGKFRGSPAVPISEYNRQKIHVRKLEEYVQRIKQLEEKVAFLSQSLS
jgi:UDP-3-O-[3-hydroxymyristoyl] glucosamine N-acyltransferase